MGKILVLLLIVGVIAGMIWIIRGQGAAAKLTRQHHPRPLDEVKAIAGGKSKAQELDRLRHSRQFWGVEIQHPGCDAARKLGDRKFSFDEAPSLPVEGCTAAQCSCLYAGLKEHRVTHRRTQQDRRENIRFDAKKPDRRKLKDRRRHFDQWKGRS